jgi:hypothetical protein
VSLKDASPGISDAKADFGARKYSSALIKISRILGGSAAKPGIPQRYDLFMLRGECLLQKRISPQAAVAFAAALHEVDFAAEPEKAGRGSCHDDLDQGLSSPGLPAQQGCSSNRHCRGGFAQKALTALFEQRFTTAEPDMQAAITSFSLLPTKKAAPHAGRLIRNRADGDGRGGAHPCGNSRFR